MNRKQRYLILIGTLIMVAMGLFPPWRNASASGDSTLHRLGYHPVFAPPSALRFYGPNNEWHQITGRVVVHYHQLFYQWGIVLIGVTGGFLFLKDERS